MEKHHEKSTANLVPLKLAQLQQTCAAYPTANNKRSHLFKAGIHQQQWGASPSEMSLEQQNKCRPQKDRNAITLQLGV